ncbi:MAG: phosphatidate cytidylyltransferase [Candidatus Calescibacterium sp.]|nr:phosphatidate cytidylyltransferase [Candidatus Calescibacterium sp.]MDW8132667.1 phosphatidate cytidylyltransferase [Candidatus Calescibacterium sp.]
MIKKPQKFVLRIVTGLLLGSLFIFSVFENKLIFYTMVIFFQIISIWELKKMFPNSIDTFFWLFLVIWMDSIILLDLHSYNLISNLSYFNKSILVPFSSISIVILLIFILKNILNSKNIVNDIVFKNTITEFFLFFYFIVSLSLSFVLFEIKKGLFFLLVVVTNYSHDIFAYFSGKIFGKTPFFNNISPSKTLEGYIGGSLLSFLIGLFIAEKLQLFELGMVKIVVIIFLISFFCAFGDLFESLAKRVANVKESGSIILGHGGVLDRLDSLIFSIFISSSIYFLI